MSEQRRTRVVWMAALFALSVSGTALAEEEAPAPEAIKTEYVWVATEAGKRIGIERLRGVVRPKKKRYLST